MSGVRQAHPLGPLVFRLEARRPVVARLWAAAVALGCLALLGLSRWLEPDPRGLGTHEQLGGWQCVVPLVTGYPCPTCGMTTAFAHTVRGQWGAAFHAQPAGLVLCLAVMAAAGLALGVLASGKTWHLNWYRVSPAWVPLAVLGLLLLGWGYKIAAGLLDGSLPVAPGL